jgi:hypothetical protein
MWLSDDSGVSKQLNNYQLLKLGTIILVILHPTNACIVALWMFYYILDKMSYTQWLSIKKADDS